MKEIDRRSVLTGILCGAAIATVGLTVMPQTAKSLPSGGPIVPPQPTNVRRP